jgi:hypothetical protein
LVTILTRIDLGRFRICAVWLLPQRKITNRGIEQ